MTPWLAVLLLAAPARAAAPSALLAVTPEEIRTTPTRVLAEAVVARVRRECDEAGPAAGEAPAAGARLVMMVPAKVFPAIARFGFLNRHQTGTTGGEDRLAERFEEEQELAMARLPYDLKGRELLPKYAFLDAPDRGLGRFLLPRRYGEVAVVFKSSTAARATWTYADSLDFSRRDGRADLGPSNPVLPHTLSYRRRAGDRQRCVNYCEAQIWGELRLDDVDYVMIPEGAPVPRGAARAGLAVYRYSVPKSTAAAGAPARTLVYRRGARVKTARDEELPSDAEFRAMPELAGLRDAFAEARLTDEQAAARLNESRDPAERLRLTGTLAARRKTPPVNGALSLAFRDADPSVRSVALHGLMEAPETVVAVLLGQAARDPDWRVRVSAAALSADFRSDPAVAAARDALKADSERRLADPADDRAAVVLEWLSRADRPRLCAAPSR